ncbi:hypothetical protein [Glutamicibacter ardleyensis]|uniref:hypothetical protein n=1 Tax=Glutamicibacter ardleyensis TaxID=225894 RepID=UPI003FD11CAC
MSNHNRVRRGIREGGQYTYGRQAEASVSLMHEPKADTNEVGFKPEPPAPETLVIEPTFGAKRAEMLASKGYVPAVATQQMQANDARDWWDKHETLGEYGERNRSVMRMPNNATPNKTPGRGDGGTRMTHRRTYEGGGESIKMPSVTSIRRTSSENNDATLAVPVLYKDANGNNVECDVHVTKTAPGQWHVTAKGVDDPKQAARIAETVQASLEARRISGALVGVDWDERRRQRHAAEGTVLHPVPNSSKFVTGMAYNNADGLLVMQMGKKQYGYHVDRNVYEQLLQSTSPGKVYNELVKKQARANGGRVAVQQCDQCKRFTSANEQHRCPGFHKALKGNGAAATRSARKRASVLAQSQGDKIYQGKSSEGTTPVAQSPLSIWDAQAASHAAKDSGWTRPAVRALQNGHMFEVDTEKNLYGFRGVGRSTAKNLHRSLPAHVLYASHNGAPNLSKMLQSTDRVPGLEVLGQITSPKSKDEGVRGTGLRVHSPNLVKDMRGLSEKMGPEKLDQQIWLKVASVVDLPSGEGVVTPKTRIVRTLEGNEAVELSWI